MINLDVLAVNSLNFFTLEYMKLISLKRKYLVYKNNDAID